LTVLRIAGGRRPAAEFQKAFTRAGHAYAGVFVVFALVAQILADGAYLRGFANVLARDGIWAAAIFFPAGFSAPRLAAEPSSAGAASVGGAAR
jgi:hypothetical protein